MYVGRIVAMGQTRSGANSVLYRVSSRSFPNRQVVLTRNALAVVPRPGYESDSSKNPYIAYNALRLTGNWAIASNGSQTDSIAEKIESNLPVRDSLIASLLELDYEKDAYSTPRIAAIVSLRGRTGWFGIIRKDALIVREVPLEPGRVSYLATYEADDIRDDQSSEFDASNADQAARFIIDRGTFVTLEKPITSAAALAGNHSFQLGKFVVL